MAELALPRGKKDIGGIAIQGLSTSAVCDVVLLMLLPGNLNVMIPTGPTRNGHRTSGVVRAKQVKKHNET